MILELQVQRASWFMTMWRCWDNRMSRESRGALHPIPYTTSHMSYSCDWPWLVSFYNKWVIKEYVKAIYCHPTYLTYIYTSWETLGSTAGIKIAGRNINNLRYADDTTLMAESEEELKSLLMKVKEESGKVVWKLNIQKTKILASSPITSWQIDGETVETVADLIFLGSKITADGDCSHEIKRHLLLGRKVMTNLDSILKRKDTILQKKKKSV